MQVEFVLDVEDCMKIVTVQDHAFFCLTRQEAICLPRRAFSDDEEFTEFVETARRYLEASGRA